MRDAERGHRRVDRRVAVVDAEQALAAAAREVVDQPRVGRRERRLRGDELVEARVAVVPVGLARRRRVRARVGVPVRRCGRRVRAVRRKVREPRPRANADARPHQPLDRLVAQQRRRVLALVRVVVAVGALVVLPRVAVAERRALEPAVEALVRVEVRFAKQPDLVALARAQQVRDALVVVQRAVDVARRRRHHDWRRHRDVRLDVVEVAARNRLRATRAAESACESSSARASRRPTGSPLASAASGPSRRASNPGRRSTRR